MDAFMIISILLTVFRISQGQLGIENATALPQNRTGERFPNVERLNRTNARTPRRLLHKIHSGVAFLTGLKLGTILNNKNFDLGHGSLAASHSFHLFGKAVNSALSLSYGDVAPVLPEVNDVPQNGSYGVVENVQENTKRLEEGENVIHVTVIQNPSVDTFEKLKLISSAEPDEEKNAKKLSPDDNLAEEEVEKEPQLYQDETTTSSEKSETSRKNEFLEEHNQRVQKFNENLIRRTNSKF